MTDLIHVAVGVIFNDAQDSVLISRRGKHQHLAGFWEFPGGKLNNNESTRQALERELYEELGIHIQSATPLMQVSHAYAEKQVLLDIYNVLKWQGEPCGREQQEIRWVALCELDKIRFPAANRRIVTRLQLPSVCIITRSSDIDFERISQLSGCEHASMLQLRLENSDQKHLSEMIQQLHDCNRELKLIINGVPEDIKRYGVNGLHLKASKMLDYNQRPVSNNIILGASCHNLEELEQAQRLDVDYVFYSPVKATISHPDAIPLGWQRFSESIRNCKIPVYALGGMRTTDIAMARQNGAHGIAMMNHFWDSQETVKLIRTLI